MKIYEATYCYDKYESVPGTISIHRTKEGARKALKMHILEKYNEWKKYHGATKESMERVPFAYNECWEIFETKLIK